MYTIILETPEAHQFETWTPTFLMEHPQEEKIQAKSPEKEKEDGGAWQTVSKNKKHVEGDGIEEKSKNVPKSSTSSLRKSNNNIALEKDAINFFAGNPTVEINKGVIHLYRDTESKEPASVKRLPAERSNILLVLAVPSFMSISDFCSFCGAFMKTIEHMRIISDTSPNRYMVAMRFTDQSSADEFYQHYNGKQFTSFDPEVCYVGFVRKVEFIQPSKASLFPPKGLTELPNCPICLEKLDASESGILTILCNHACHCECLSRWRKDNMCPICRYVQPVGHKSQCANCSTTESLWICVVCGHVGCSRYKESHAYDHFKLTQHTYALELETGRVWDYAGDGYVHRLIQNQMDGKIVELPGQAHADDRDGGNRIVHKDLDKVETIALEYQYLLTAQLETQKVFFEELLEKLEKEKEERIQKLSQQSEVLSKEQKEAVTKLKETEKEKKKAEKKSQELEKKLNEVSKETQFLKELNQALETNQKAWQDKIENIEKNLVHEKDRKIKELEEQVRDLMFYIEAQKKIEDSTSELKDGQLIVVPDASPQKNNNNTTPGRRTPRNRRK
eukprot:TRINITY_DN13019_c0_g1_i1.p1 TRINITY_DN13019_c0_g1~~TRINITY_DN13019_c0_g1_i1.p1  ORF type:complete len:561 (+),score=138.51 TRINITY_DN13019_c0_g1_i1:30-1712(+)